LIVVGISHDQLLELQSGVAGCVGEGRYTAVILVSSAVKNHGFDTSRLSSLSKQTAYFACSFFVASRSTSQLDFRGRGGCHGAAVLIVNNLS
jgi:hypothetical protein